jgi:methionyl-tRNA synthetase
LPFTSERLHTYLGYETPLFGGQATAVITDDLADHEVLQYQPQAATGRWQPSQIVPGKVFQNPEPLFRKLDESIIQEEQSRLGTPAR